MMTMASANEKKAARAIASMCNTLGQTLKQFGGLYTSKLTYKGKPVKGYEDTTVEQFMESMGVERFKKNGKVSGGYTPGLIKAAWHKSLQGENKQMLRFVEKPAKYTDSDGEVLDVYASVEEAEKAGGKKITRLEIVSIPDDRWSVDTILGGLLQSKHYDELEENMVEKDLEWEGLESCYIRRKSRNAEGKVVYTAHEIIKDAVEF